MSSESLINFDEIRLIDTDSHIAELPDLWTSRVASRWHDRVPRVIDNMWVLGADAVPLHMLTTYAHAGWGEFPPGLPQSIEECTPGAFYADERLKQLDEFGIYAQVQYPNVMGFHGKAMLESLSPDVALLCTQVYNDFLTEFCTADPNRLIAISSMPWWDPAECVKEIERCAANGHHGILFSVDWEKVGLPPINDPHWAPVLKAAEEASLPINLHVGFGQAHQAELKEIFGNGEEGLFSRFDPTVSTGDGAIMYLSCSRHIAKLATCGVLDTYPGLKFVTVESGVGWLPFLMEALDWNWMNFGAMREFPDRELPSFYIKRQVYGNYWFESSRNLRHATEVLPDNIMFETDFPHTTGLNPGAGSFAMPPRDHARQSLEGLPEIVIRKVMYENAASLYAIK